MAPNVKELVIAGDLLDEWFVPATVDTYQGKNQADFVKRIAATNKGVFDVINNIIHEGKILVTYVPGNHDLTITAANVERILPGINQARDEEHGLGTYSPVDYSRIGLLSYIQKFPPAGDILPVVTQNTSGNGNQNLLFIYWNVWSRALTKYTIANKFDERIIVTNVDIRTMQKLFLLITIMVKNQSMQIPGGGLILIQ